MNPYYLGDRPCSLNVSGGRTSGYLLAKVLEAYGGNLPEYIVPVFANTGKERPETYDFLQEMERHWNVEIVWIEMTFTESPGGAFRYGQRVVDYDSASKDGQPFAMLIEHNKFVPNVFMRFCTRELKIRPIARYMKQRFGETTNKAIGVRADEHRRLAQLRQMDDTLLPIVDARHTKQDVLAFWDKQLFDLGIPPDLTSVYGNCDLCFLKGRSLRKQVLTTNPEVADWWIQQERNVGGTFDKGASVVQILDLAQQDKSDTVDGSVDCYCGD